MSLGSDLAASDLQTKITDFLAPDRIASVFWSRQGKGQVINFPFSSLASPGSLSAEGLAGTSWSRTSPCACLSRKEQKVVLGQRRAMARVIQKEE